MNTTHKYANRPVPEGVTLETMVTRLFEHMGWEAMGTAVPIRCFTHDPSIKSSLKFLRRTPWARTKVENLYIATNKSKLKKGRSASS